MAPMKTHGKRTQAKKEGERDRKGNEVNELNYFSPKLVLTLKAASELFLSSLRVPTANHVRGLLGE